MSQDPLVKPWATGISAITLFVEDLPAGAAFYRDVLGLAQVFEDDVSVAFRLGGTIVNVLTVDAAAELVEPGTVGRSDGGPRYQLTIEVTDADAVCAELAERRVRLLNGPIDRPWGVRTAAFTDPAGHLWEIAQPLPEAP